MGTPHHASNNVWPALHGARALSIILVLVCHLFPLGPKTYVDLNIATGQLGISIFFALSAFLITHKLLTEPSISAFAINRFFRIVPLLWLMLLLTFCYRLISPDLIDPAAHIVASHFLLIANNWPTYFVHETKHLWSVCVEAHFYLLAGFLFWALKRKGLIVLACAGVLMMAYRAGVQQYFNTTTFFRLDELFVALWIGLIYSSSSTVSIKLQNILSRINPWIPLLALSIASLAPPHPILFPLRPVLAALFIGVLIHNQTGRSVGFFQSTRWRWMSDHSYALYVIHPFLLITWLGSGDKITMYMKRPLMLLALFALAWLSTRYYERFFIGLGRKLIKRFKAPTTVPNTQSIGNAP